MDTKPIFDFIQEVSTYKSWNTKETDKYFDLIREQEWEFKRTLLQCSVESERFKEVLPIIEYHLLEGLKRLQERYITQEKAVGDEAVPYNLRKMRLAKFCIDKVCSLIELIEVQYLHKEKNPAIEGINTAETDEEMFVSKPRGIKGVRGLAEYLGCSPNTVMKIIKTGVLEQNKIQTTVGNTYHFSVERLDKYIEENPSDFK